MNKIDLIIDALYKTKLLFESHGQYPHTLREVDEALAAARELRELQPVAWMVLTQDDKKLMLYGEEKPPIFNTPVKLIPLYAAPPKSDNELDAIDKSIHEEMERLKTEIKRLKELAEYRLKLLMKMPEQADLKPVAWMLPAYGDVLPASQADGTGIYNVPLYTAPPRKPWVGLTDEEIKGILDCGRGGLVDIKKAEQILKEKNT